MPQPTAPPSLPANLRQLRESGWISKTVKEEMREFKNSTRGRNRDVMADASASLTHALAEAFPDEMIVAKLQEMLKSKVQRYDKSGNLLFETTDTSTVKEALRFIAEYKVGRPIERKQVISAQVESNQDLAELLSGSAAARDALVKLLKGLPKEIVAKLRI